FRQFGVNNINAYTKLYKEGKEHPTDDSYPHEPLPHLFLISDEFAELKANEPDFMDELVSTARIGRSLGVHLILETQKPNGVVSEQIWSNSRFKIALKVSDPADSKEIIHTPDAASITQVGRAYLQVGNNETYELFQSAYSSAEYNPTDNQHAQRDQRLWLINQLGQAELLTRDLSEIDEPKESEIQTQLEAVVDEIAKDAKEAQVKMPMKPWLPPLPESLVGPELDWQTAWQQPRQLKVPFGMLDIPSRQTQEKLDFDLSSVTPALFVGSSGYGKSVALQTIVANLARLNSPEQVNFYLFDFGTNGLLPLAGLPHVADIAGFDNREKLWKMLTKINQLINQRKSLFQQLGVSNFSQYEEEIGQPLPIIVIAVDAYDSVAEDDERDGIDGIISKLLRDGKALGIYSIYTVNRLNTFRYQLLSNINKRIGLFMVDEDEVVNTLGRNALIQSPIAGRGQMEIDDEMLAFQIYTPTEHADSLKIVHDLRVLSETMTEAWDGPVPAKIPMLPNSFDFAYADKKIKAIWHDRNIMPIALGNQTTEVHSFDPEIHHFFNISYLTEQQKDVLSQAVTHSLSTWKHPSWIVDVLGEFHEQHEQYSRVITDNENDLIRLKQQMADYAAAGVHRELRDEIYVFIPNLTEFIKVAKLTQQNFEIILQHAWKAGMYLIIMDNRARIDQSYDAMANMIKAQTIAGLVSARIVDTNYISATGVNAEPQLLSNEAYFFESKGLQYSKVKLPQVNRGNE
ncbi:FtsK/SpoIIIE domain-containing protein, partial [Limosilactobacillus equigenerosi]